MKKIILLLIGACIVFPCFCQTPKQKIISAYFKDEKLENVLQEFEKIFEIKFSYIYSLIEDVKINASLNQDPLEHALNIILENTSFQFKIIDEKNVAIIKDVNKKLIIKERFTIKGIVTDSYGQPLEGAEVYVPLIKKSVLSNKEGEYEIKNLPNGKLYINSRKEHYYKFSDFININKDLRADIQLSIASRYSKNESAINPYSQESRSILEKKVNLKVIMQLCRIF